MRKIIISFVLLVILKSININAQTYTIQIRLEDYFWNNKPDKTLEWECYAIADLFKNDTLQNPADYTYQWKANSTGSFQLAGTNYIEFKDGNPNDTYQTYVVITGENYHDSSDAITIGLYGNPKLIPLHGLLQSGAEIPANNYFQNFTNPHWANANFYKSGDDTSYVLALGETQFTEYNTLRINPFDLTSYEEKFNYWNDASDILNFNNFFHPQNLSVLNAHFKQRIKNITIGVNFPEYSQNDIQIGFRDPWLVDHFVSQNLGSQNQGTDAPPYYNHSWDFSDPSLDNYKGVLKNQNPNFLPNIPIYSIRTPLAPIVNGSTAFFTGWGYSGITLDGGYHTTDGYDSARVVFTSSSASITANYSYSTISTNNTLGAGTYTIAGNLTVSSGATLTINSGVTLKFPSGHGLIVNGKLVTNGGKFTHISGTWDGITFNSAEGSSLTNLKIYYASSPIVINNTDDITISGGTLGYSKFYNGDINTAAAIQINGSSPTISGVTIEGNGVSGSNGSWNGVRFTNYSTGTLTNCTIQNLGYGNGVIVQGGSAPTISYNNINHNYYHGIYINGTGSTTVLGNTLDYNGQGGSYVGLYFYTGSGVVRMNTIKHTYYGLWCRYSSSISAGGVNQTGSNTITNNSQRGLLSTDYSSVNFGDGNQHNQYWGTCNNIYSNNLTDASAERNGYITARYNWWGKYPPSSSQFYSDGSSSVDYAYPLQYSGDCPGLLMLSVDTTQSALINSSNTQDNSSSLDPQSVIKQALTANLSSDFSQAKSLCRDLLKDSKISDSFHMQALSVLFGIFQASGDASIVDDFTQFISTKNELSPEAGLLLATVYAGMGKTSDAERVASDLKSVNPNSDIEKRALFTLASLSTYNPAYKDKSKAALNELVSKYGSSFDAGILAAFGVSVNNSIQKQASQLESKTQKTDTDSLTFSLDNYPNPFNPTTIIHYVLPKAGLVSLKIYDMLGKEVSTLVNEYKTKGVYDVTFNAANLASGVYIYQLRAGKFVANKKLLLMK